MNEAKNNLEYYIYWEVYVQAKEIKCASVCVYFYYIALPLFFVHSFDNSSVYYCHERTSLAFILIVSKRKFALFI